MRESRLVSSMEQHKTPSSWVISRLIDFGIRNGMEMECFIMNDGLLRRRQTAMTLPNNY